MNYENLNGKGIQIFFTDGTDEYFDPIQSWLETEDEISFFIGGHTWKFNISEILKIRDFELCTDCGYELEYGSCGKCAEENIEIEPECPSAISDDEIECEFVIKDNVWRCLTHNCSA